MSPRARAHAPSTARRPAPTTERGADKREAILQAALELFVERGFHGTAVPEVAERAGVGAGTIYRYFASKEALVNELYQQQKSRLLARILRDFPVAASAREQFGTLWRRMAAYAKEEPLGFAFLELHNHQSYLDADSKALEERITQFGLGFIAQAQARGDIRAVDPMLLVGIVMGAFIGLVRRSTECGLVLDDPAWTTAEQCVWEAIRV
ncbi:MAG: TetR family transcriptional regulator [Deltaproteobacteria bacterium]|nr:TetR family transcriptional regulator [Kofleriaceae bacterium]